MHFNYIERRREEMECEELIEPFEQSEYEDDQIEDDE